MTLLRLTEADKYRYNEFVASHQRDAFLQSWEWGEWQKALGKTVQRFALHHGDHYAAVGQFIKLPPNRSPIWYAPRGPIIDPVSLKTLDQFLSQVKSELPGALGIRIEPESVRAGLPSVAKRTLPSQPEKTAILDLTLHADELMKKMHEKTRYNIRLAERKGVTVTAVPASELTDELIDQCIHLLQATAERQQFRNHPTSYLEKFLRHFKSLGADSDLKVSIYFASFENQAITTAVMVDFGRTRMYLYGGSSEAYRNVMAPYLLHWKAITDAQEQGLEFYDLGGSETIGKKQAGFTRFKSGFNGAEISYSGTWDVPIKKALYPLYALSRKLNRIKNKLF